MSALYFYDDVRARQFEPFALTRPGSELRAGTSLIRRRWERATGLESAGFISSPHLAQFEEGKAPPALVKGEVPAGSIIVNTRCVIPLDLELDRFDLLMCEGSACAVRLARAMPVSQFADGSTDIGSIQTSLGGRKIAGRWITDVWEFTGTLTDQLMEDIPRRAKSLTTTEKTSAATIGDHGIFVEEGADIGPNVVLDASAGPILIRRGAIIAPFTHLVGPISVGRDSQVLGDRVANSSIGDSCKVRGELSNTIFIGHSNKAHAGFVGHSYLGRWVNLGALTTTSNLPFSFGRPRACAAPASNSSERCSAITQRQESERCSAPAPSSAPVRMCSAATCRRRLFLHSRGEIASLTTRTTSLDFLQSPSA